ncbi:hypothetical protein CDL15_Pgr013474 [Punica granatum]|uniref:MADS-box domain-containing protein n=1 Tax=Punica granatum TaxID=22663 RepID=A0A218W099_PUNGR|nr:hypothetical protein CDL15_Pgr013474 [Punica granatum]
MRRATIYKQASELATLCCAEIGIVIFSPTGKPFSFGTPSIEVVVERYLKRNLLGKSLDNGDMQTILEADQTTRIRELREALNETLSQLEAKRMHGKSLQQLIKASRAANATRGEVNWWDAKIRALSTPQLEQASASMEQFYGDLMNHMKQGNNNNDQNNNNSDNGDVATSTDSLLEAENFDDEVSDFEAGNEASPDEKS